MFIFSFRSDSFRLACNYIGTPPGYQSLCVQKEIEHRLTTIDTDPSTSSVSTSVDIFKFPSYCACKLIPGQLQSQSPNAGLCSGQFAAPLPQSPPSAAGVYGLVGAYGADDAATAKSLKVGSRAATTAATRKRLSGRTLDLFGASVNSNNGRVSDDSPPNFGWMTNG